MLSLTNSPLFNLNNIWLRITDTKLYTVQITMVVGGIQLSHKPVMWLDHELVIWSPLSLVSLHRASQMFSQAEEYMFKIHLKEEEIYTFLSLKHEPLGPFLELLKAWEIQVEEAGINYLAFYLYHNYFPENMLWSLFITATYFLFACSPHHQRFKIIQTWCSTRGKGKSLSSE